MTRFVSVVIMMLSVLVVAVLIWGSPLTMLGDAELSPFQAYKQAQSIEEPILLNPDTSSVQIPKATDRGRVQIADGTLVADNGFRLRGEHLRVSMLAAEDREGTEVDRSSDLNVWRSLVNDHHLNTVRLLLYRPPQRWSDTDPEGCPPPERCFATVQDAIPHIDTMVEIASMMGMYVIIDYHPVGGYYREDAEAWWRELAPRYKDRTHVIYELANEPVAWSAGAYSPEDIQFQEDMYLLIREYAPDTHIILWSFAEGTGNGHLMLDRVEAAPDISYENASIAYHPYRTESYAEMITLQNAGYAVIDTEIGGYSREEYATRTVAEEDFGVSWMWLDGSGYGKPWAESDPLPVTWPRDPKTMPDIPSVATPEISPDGGVYTEPITITLNTDTDGAALFYTLDGTTPTTSSFAYNGPFVLTESAVVNAKAFQSGLVSSAVARAQFTIGVVTPTERVRTGLQALYTFAASSGNEVLDQSGVGQPLDLRIEDSSAVSWLSPGLAILEPTVLHSSGPASKLFDALRATQELSIEAWVQPANRTQEGPARIIAYSHNAFPDGGNFVVGQEFGALHARVRTTTTDQYGLPSLNSSSDVVVTEPMHVVFTREDTGETALYVDSQLIASGKAEGDFTNWGEQYVLALANEPGGERPWLGTLYLAAIYDRALSSDEVNQNFHAGIDDSAANPSVDKDLFLPVVRY